MNIFTVSSAPEIETYLFLSNLVENEENLTEECS
jgi:hypothetical protein